MSACLNPFQSELLTENVTFRAFKLPYLHLIYLISLLSYPFILNHLISYLLHLSCLSCLFLKGLRSWGKQGWRVKWHGRETGQLSRIVSIAPTNSQMVTMDNCCYYLMCLFEVWQDRANKMTVCSVKQEPRFTLTRIYRIAWWVLNIIWKAQKSALFTKSFQTVTIK